MFRPTLGDQPLDALILHTPANFGFGIVVSVGNHLLRLLVGCSKWLLDRRGFRHRRNGHFPIMTVRPGVSKRQRPASPVHY